MTEKGLQQLKNEVFEKLWRELPASSRKRPRNRGNRIPQNELKQERARELMDDVDDDFYVRHGTVDKCVDSLFMNHWIETM